MTQPYPKYKSTGVDWLGSIPRHWDFGRLKFSATSKTSNVDKHTKDNEVPILLCNYVDVYNNEFISSDTDFMSATATAAEIDRFTLRKNDVLITKDSESWDDIAVPAFVASELEGVLCGYHLAIVRSLPGKFYPRYLFRLFCSEVLNYQFKVSANGVTRFGLPSSAIDHAILLRPPIDEQQVISDFIDRETARIDALLEKRRRLLELLDERRHAIITNAVTKGLDPKAPLRESGVDALGKIPAHWKMVRLKLLADVIDCKHITPKYVADGLPLVSTSEVKPFSISFTDARKVSEEDFASMTEGGRLPVADDIIYSRNASIGSAARVGESKIFCMGQDICLIRPTHARSQFLEFALNCKAVHGQIESIFVGSTFKRINVDRIRNFWLPVPPSTEQDHLVREIVAETLRLDRVRSAVRLAINYLSEYRSTLITNAVTGKIDVRGSSHKEVAA
jgi:type I restriction enzyme S subunit